MLGPTWLKLRLGVDEVVTTLLLNYVALLFVGMLLEGPMQDPMSLGWPQSAPVVADAELPRLVEHPGPRRLGRGAGGSRPGLALERTVWGFEARAVGGNARAARFAGMPVARVLLGPG